MLYIKASLTINSSISKMKYIWFFNLYNVIFSTSPLNTTGYALDYGEHETMLHTHTMQKTRKMLQSSHANDQKHQGQAHLRRYSRDFTNTIEKIPTRLRNDLVEHQRFIRQTEMCHQTPCQRMPFLVSYQVK